jgi:uncharacterized protein (DUF2384 family)
VRKVIQNRSHKKKDFFNRQNTYIFVTNVVILESFELIYNIPEEENHLRLAAEEPVEYVSLPKPISINDFNELNSILELSQAEWALILHISSRTLQRHLKEGTPFDGLHGELILHLQRLTNLGMSLFSNASSFVEWSHTRKTILGYSLGFNALQSITGIRLLRQELGRIAEGIYI